MHIYKILFLFCSKTVTVRLGELDYATENDIAEPQDFNVVKIYLHPDRIPQWRYHDIALLQLDRKVVFSQFIRPACLYTKQKESSSKLLFIIICLRKINEFLFFSSRIYCHRLGRNR